jgi:hypothetical protein
MRNPILYVAAVIVLAIAMTGVAQSERTNPAQQDDRIIAERVSRQSGELRITRACRQASLECAL